LFRAGPLAEVLAELAAGPVEGWQHDISRDVLPRMIEAGLRVRVFPVEGYWADIGTVERYHLGHLALLADPGMLPAGQLPRTLAAIAPVRSPAGNLVGAGVTVGGEVRRSVLGPGCVVEPGAVVERSVLLPGARVPAGVRVIDTVVVDGETLSADRVGLAELAVPAGPVPAPERKG
jgi:glucose-1-phosphate adenylyltransferase